MNNDHSAAENTRTNDAAEFDTRAALEAELADAPTEPAPDAKYEIPVHLDAATRRAVNRAFAAADKSFVVDATFRSPGVRDALAGIQKHFSVPKMELPPNVFTKFDIPSLTVPIGPGVLPTLPPVLTGPADSFTVPSSFAGMTADFRRRISEVAPTPIQLSMPSIEAMVPSIGLAQHDRITRAISSVENYRAIADRIIPKLIVPTFTGLHAVQATMQGLSNSIGKLLADWGSLSDLGHSLARMGLRAARDARAAVVAGDIDAVKAFARAWLGLKKITKAVIEAVSAALLDPGWETEQPEAVLPYIKHGTKREKKNHKLLGEIRAGRSRILPLDRTLNIGNGTSTSFAEILPGPDVQLRAAYENPLALEFLEYFSEIEIEILETHLRGGVTWASAATECGQQVDVGEKVRRKFQYRKKKMADAVIESRRRTA